MAALTDLLKRKEEELRWKLVSLPDELKEWRERAAEKQALQKNHSQISRLSLRIEGLQAVVNDAFDQAVRAGELWLRAESLEKKALVVHAVWDQFRSRLSLRLVSPFDTYLALADAYARECYVPVYRELRGLASDQLCPAPLVTFDEQNSPWMKPETVEGDLEGDGSGLPSPQQFQEALDQLPLTLVGIPWSYLSYLPHMSLLAHEIGHALERSARLTDALDQAIECAAFANEERKEAWKAWRKEVFADFYGFAMGGPAFVAALADHLANDGPRIIQQTRPHQNGSWTLYPTATIRILFCCHGLRVMGFADEADTIANPWSQAYPENRMREFSADFEPVMNAFCSVCDLRQTAYGGFSRQLWNTATTIANLYRQGGGLPNDQSRPARTYVTAARLLMQKPPQTGSTPALWQKLRQHHLTTRPAGVAGGAQAQVSNVVAAQERAQADQLAGILFANI